MAPSAHAICLHGHFYQPPREDPWTGVVDAEPSAVPDRDWNLRITRECYAPYGAARVLDHRGRLADVVNLWEWTSFNVGPTLGAWLAGAAPGVLAAMRAGDAACRARTGHGSAWAQAWGHAILPLSTPRDVRTQVRWGVRDFVARFGREPAGMWLPEMAVDGTALDALAEAGISLTVLAPHQARRIRPLGAGEGAWETVSADTLDVRRLYRVRLPSGAAVDVVFRDAALSRDVAFGALLRDGALLAARLRELVHDGGPPALVTAAVDGETFGHHHRFAEMAIAFAVRALAADPGVAMLPPAAFRELAPPAWEVEIAAGTSWSCAHGVERWRDDCGCRVGGPAAWTQAWRRPLRTAIDWLRDELAAVFEAVGGAVLRDPWAARDRYVECLLDPGRLEAFLGTELLPGVDVMGRRRARTALAVARHALAMQTSCGWFFDDLGGVEPRIVLRHAARAIELAGRCGAQLETGFLDRLRDARSNDPALGDGVAVYRRAVGSPRVTPPVVAGTAALLGAFGASPAVPGYTVDLPGRYEGMVRVREEATGDEWNLPLAVALDGGTRAVARCGEASVGVRDMLPVGAEGLVAAIGTRVADAVAAARGGALGPVEPILLGVLAADVPIPRTLARDVMARLLQAIRLGEAPAVPPGVIAALRRGGITSEALAGGIAGALACAIGRLPAAASAAHLALDLAHGLEVTLDATEAQLALLAWWRAADATARAADGVRSLLERLAIVPDGV